MDAYVQAHVSDDNFWPESETIISDTGIGVVIENACCLFQMLFNVTGTWKNPQNVLIVYTFFKLFY